MDSGQQGCHVAGWTLHGSGGATYERLCYCLVSLCVGPAFFMCHAGVRCHCLSVRDGLHFLCMHSLLPSCRLLLAAFSHACGMQAALMEISWHRDFNVAAMASDQKMTRHKKRRHDDIHHVGQVTHACTPCLAPIICCSLLFADVFMV